MHGPALNAISRRLLRVATKPVTAANHKQDRDLLVVERISLKQIEDLEARIAKVKTQARETTKAAHKPKIDRLLNGTEFSVHEIYGLNGKSGRAGRSIAKCTNPNDASQTWTGRGRRPDWLIAHVKMGANLQDFAI